jgi:anti-sigma regulatory factor (Ser/Thr protein kinase)
LSTGTGPTCRQTPDEGQAGGRILRFPDLDCQGLEALLTRHYGVFLESDGAADGWPGPVPDPDRGFVVSLRTGTAIGAQLAPAVCSALQSRDLLEAGQRASVELCLQEAIANAIIHGNLGISSDSKARGRDHELFSLLLTQRLADPVLAERRVEIAVGWAGTHLEFTVSDQGAGFDPTLTQGTPDPRGRSGRGFVLMHALAETVTVADGGRRTILRFPRQTMTAGTPADGEGTR